MTIEKPIWMQGNTYPARLDRALIAAMYDEGILTGFKVTQRGAGANMSVDVAAGKAVIQGDDQADQGNYYARSTVTENAAVTAAPGSNSRIDIVVLKINDPNAGGPAGSNMQIQVIAGAAAASPVTPAVPASALLLATIGPILTSTTSIPNAMITDARTLAGRRDSPGRIELLGGSRVPSGWLLCNGQTVSRTTYADLFDQIGVSYGPGDGATTFTLPDLRNRVPVAKGSGTFAVEGATGGAETVTLTESQIPAHTHTGPSHTHTGPSHTHTIDHDHGNVLTDSQGAHQHSSGLDISTTHSVQTGATVITRALTGLTGSAGAHQHNVDLPSFAGSSGAAGTGATGPAGTGPTGSTGGGNAHTNLPPYQVVGGFIIRT